MTSIISDNIKQNAKILPLEDITVGERYRKLDEAHVSEIALSFERMGGQLQIQPIVVDEHMRLIDGAHRLEAAKRSGWTHISASVLEGATDRDREILEIEANRVRLQFSPAQLEAAWTKHYAPALKQQAKQAQVDSGYKTQQKLGNIAVDGQVMGNSHNLPQSSISVRDAAKQVTGIQAQTLNKITQIRETAEDETAPLELREAAQAGMEKLHTVGASVDAVHKAVLAKKNQLLQQTKTPEELRAEHLRKRMDMLLFETTGIEQKLGESLLKDIQEAAKTSTTDLHDLRASRNAIVLALVKLLAVEAAVAEHPGHAFYELGNEISKQISERGTEQLEELIEDE